VESLEWVSFNPFDVASKKLDEMHNENSGMACLEFRKMLFDTTLNRHLTWPLQRRLGRGFIVGKCRVAIKS
jgi:ribosomal protein L13E